MTIDLDYLRQHYASLSEDGLRAIARADLVPSAQECYDEELRRRETLSTRSTGRKDGLRSESARSNADGAVSLDGLEQPEWVDGAAEVFSRADHAGTTPAPDIEEARKFLESAGIPCFLDVSEIPEENYRAVQPPTHLWRLKVPGEIGLHAMSVLESDIFNSEFEAQWKTYLETLSDTQLPTMTPEAVLVGLFDRVDRVARVFEEEIAPVG